MLSLVYNSVWVEAYPKASGAEMIPLFYVDHGTLIFFGIFMKEKVLAVLGKISKRGWWREPCPASATGTKFIIA
jgi:hypothetical protein